MERSVTVTPDISTAVCDCSPVKISCGFGCGSSQNGLGSLLRAASHGRICGSIRGSSAAFGVLCAACVMVIAPINMAVIERLRFIVVS
jgi:hypothetical protein